MSLVSYGGRRLTDLGAPRAGSNDAVRMVDLEAASVGGGGGPGGGGGGGIPQWYPPTDYVTTPNSSPLLTSAMGGNNWTFLWQSESGAYYADGTPIPPATMVTFGAFTPTEADGSDMYDQTGTLVVVADGVYSLDFEMQMEVWSDADVAGFALVEQQSALGLSSAGYIYRISEYLPRTTLPNGLSKSLHIPPMPYLAGQSIDFLLNVQRVPNSGAHVNCGGISGYLAITKWSDG